jgi:hypothetical protein
MGLKRDPDALQRAKRYCFSTHFLPASSHTLPAFSQSSLFVMVEPGPANARAATLPDDSEFKEEAPALESPGLGSVKRGVR